MKRRCMMALALLIGAPACAKQALVLQSDFGLKDGAVAAMRGVAVAVSQDLNIHDLTHEVPTFNIWEAALRLDQTASYWPPGTVFVSVVDPGVGTERKSVVLKTKTGHLFVTPDNGTLTFVSEKLGIESVREIDEAINRVKDSEASYTFHGRDVYAYTGARLAAKVIDFEEVGRELPARVVTIDYQKARFEDGKLRGNIPILDPQYGNVWTNIDRATFRKLGLNHGENGHVIIRKGTEIAFEGDIPYQPTFGSVALEAPLIYLNSLNNVALALNQGNFARTYGIGSGAVWSIEITRPPKP